MRQSAILLARTIRFIELADLLSGGSISTSELVRNLTERYSFAKVPQTIAEMDASKGIEFLEGQSNIFGHPIKKLVIWSTGITLETLVSTEISKAILNEMLEWGAKDLGLNYDPKATARFAYISDVTFYSDAPLLNLHPAVEALTAKATELLSDVWQEPVVFHPLSIKVGHDPVARKNSIASFSIERRVDTRLSDNKYFSEAPIPTSAHWEILEQYEKDVLLHSANTKLI